MTKRILIADKIADEGIEHLRSRPGFDVDVNTGLDVSGLCNVISPYHAVIVRSATEITSIVIDRADSLQVIGRAGIGVDNIDIDYATGKGIAVLNTPDANATTTAELAVAHLLSLSRNLPQADRSVRAGEWKRSRFIGAELANKTLGIIGYGTIGRIVAARAKAFKMIVAVFDPFVTDEVCRSDNVTPLDLENLFRTADYITLHCPLNDKTRGIISAENISRMKKGARLINPGTWPERRWTCLNGNRRNNRRCWHWIISCSRPIWALPPRKPRQRRAWKSRARWRFICKRGNPSTPLTCRRFPRKN